MIRACLACGYDATDSNGILCVWCWEHVIAGNALKCLGDIVQVGGDREMVVLVMRFITRRMIDRLVIQE